MFENIIDNISQEYLMYGVIIFFVIICIIGIGFVLWEQEKVRQKIRQLADNSLELTPEEFMEMRNASYGGRGRKHISTEMEFAGVYILLNKSKDMYYVGQGKKVLNRVNQHFTGHGNGDVYADYKYGDEFIIKTIKLEDSGFDTLNELERKTIETYDAFATGYNKTRGNRG